MSSARDRVLDAFETVLVDQGARAATLDAVAAEAGVSKGGLLYHFPNKDALIDGMLARLRELGAQDVRTMLEAPEGVVTNFLTTSTYTGSDFDRAMVAASRIAQDRDARAGEALDELRRGWRDALLTELGDEVLVEGVLLMSDGLYFNAVLGVEDSDLDRALEFVARLRPRDEGTAGDPANGATDDAGRRAG